MSRFFSILWMGLAFVVDYRAVAFESPKVIISEMESFLEGIEQAEGYLYLGSYKLHQHLLPNAKILSSLQKAARKESLKNNIVMTLEAHLTQEEQKEGSEAIQAGDSLAQYKALGIKLVENSPSFHATHYKILVTQKYAFVGTTNFDKAFLEKNTITRDFSLVLTEPSIIEELVQVLEADQVREKSKLRYFSVSDIKEGQSRLTWGPEQDRFHLIELIQSATQSIEIYQQALQDKELLAYLVQAVKRGVSVFILMSQFPFGSKHGNKSDEFQKIIASTQSDDQRARGEVRLTGQEILGGALKGRRLHIHAKVILVDGENAEKAKMYLGSANFYTAALDRDRNVGIVTRDLAYIAPVREQFIKDWEAHASYFPHCEENNRN